MASLLGGVSSSHAPGVNGVSVQSPHSVGKVIQQKSKSTEDPRIGRLLGILIQSATLQQSKAKQRSHDAHQKSSADFGQDSRLKEVAQFLVSKLDALLPENADVEKFYRPSQQLSMVAGRVLLRLKNNQVEVSDSMFQSWLPAIVNPPSTEELVDSVEVKSASPTGSNFLIKPPPFYLDRDVQVVARYLGMNKILLRKLGNTFLTILGEKWETPPCLSLEDISLSALYSAQYIGHELNLKGCLDAAEFPFDPFLRRRLEKEGVSDSALQLFALFVYSEGLGVVDKELGQFGISFDEETWEKIYQALKQPSVEGQLKGLQSLNFERSQSSL